MNTAPTTHTDRHTEHDLAIDPTNSYMYCQIASRSTTDYVDRPRPSTYRTQPMYVLHRYELIVNVLECVDTEGFKRKVENDRE